MAKTFFERVEPKLLPPEGNSVKPGHFLPAVRSVILPFFELMGTAFTPVKSDINGNITSLQKKYDSDPEKYKESFRVMLEEEIAANPANKKKGTACVSLLWLKRGLQFTHLFLKQMVDDHESGTKTENLGPFCKKAYEETLKMYHGWLIQKVFSVVSHALPYRKDLVKMMAYGKEGLDDEAISHLKSFLMALEANLEVIQALLNDFGLDSKDKV